MRKSVIIGFSLIMTAVCLFLFWAAVDRQMQLGRMAQAQEDLTYQKKRVPLQERQLGEERALIPEVQARVDALRPQVEEAQRAQKAAAAALNAYREKSGLSKSSAVTKAYRGRAEEAEARLAAARETYEALLLELGLSTEEVTGP